MSHANGAVRFADGAIMFFEYSGTGDYCVPALWTTYEEMHANWRSEDPAVYARACVCEVGVWEPVSLMCDYADGHYWPGLACRKCMVITKGDHRDDNTETGCVEGYRDGEPPWSPWKSKEI